MRLEMRLTGSGGQGIILAGIALAEAAIVSGLQAVQTQAYGPEARGGASRSEVIISNDDIDYPKVTTPDIVLAMSTKAYAKYGVHAPDDATVVVDGSIVDCDVIDRDVISVPITDTAREATGRVVTANIVAVGVIARLGAVSALIDKQSVHRAVLLHVPAKTRELNTAALQAGFDLLG